MWRLYAFIALFLVAALSACTDKQDQRPVVESERPETTTAQGTASAPDMVVVGPEAPDVQADIPPLLRRPDEQTSNETSGQVGGQTSDEPSGRVAELVPEDYIDQADKQISEYIREVFQDRDGVYWFGTNGDGLARYDGASLTYISVKDGLAGSAIRGILQAPDGGMWFATEGGVSRYVGGKFTNYMTADGLSDNSVWCIFRDRTGVIWAGTHEGVCRFDGNSWTPFDLPRVDVDEPESRFTPKVVFSIFEDKAGNLWFGTDGEGAHKYDGKAFTSYTTKEGLAGNVVRSIYGDRRGRIWIGTNGGGVSCFDGTAFRNFTAKDGLSNDRVYEILEDRAGNMWFSTLGAGACRYDGKTFKAFGVDHELIINGRPARSHVQEFFEDRDGVLWLGCSGGLFRLDGETFINVTRDGPWPVMSQASAEAANLMERFARLVSGEWRLGLVNGAFQRDTWTWGPGKHSMYSRTVNSRGDGETTSGVYRVLYWHPGRKEIAMLALLWEGMLGEGVATIEGDAARFDYVLHYPSQPSRKLALDWKFDGPDKYRSTLTEDIGKDVPAFLSSWDYVRSETLTPIPESAKEPPNPVEHLIALKPLVGQSWAGAVTPANEGSFSILSTIDWIPYVEAIHARVVALRKSNRHVHLLDIYIYHHTGTGSVRCLALSNQGGVYEGGLTLRDDGALEFDLNGSEGDQVVHCLARIDFENDGSLLQQVWSAEGADRMLMYNVHHKRTGSKSD